MAHQIPNQIPAKLYIGDYWTWTQALSNYPASAWTLTYTLGADGITGTKTITASADGDTHKVTVDAETTGDYTADKYTYYARVTDTDTGDEVYTVSAGVVEIVDPAQEDPRSYWTQIYEALRSAMTSRATTAQLEKTVAGIQIKHMSHKEMIEAMEHAEERVRQEDAALASAEGRASRNNFFFRFESD